MLNSVRSCGVVISVPVFIPSGRRILKYLVPVSSPLPPTAKMLPHWSSAQQDLTIKPQENVRGPIKAILSLKSDCKDAGGPR